jgi:hypothetical protein
VTRVHAEDDPLTVTELVAAFEAGRIEPAEFPHRRHVLVAWGLQQRYGCEQAYGRLVAGLRSITRRAGRPDVFHETITRAWFELIGQSVDLDRTPELFDVRLLGRYYSPEALAAGRNEWVEPGLHPLALPPPAATSDPADARAAG